MQNLGNNTLLNLTWAAQRLEQESAVRDATPTNGSSTPPNGSSIPSNGYSTPTNGSSTPPNGYLEPVGFDYLAINERRNNENIVPLNLFDGALLMALSSHSPLPCLKGNKLNEWDPNKIKKDHLAFQSSQNNKGLAAQNYKTM